MLDEGPIAWVLEARKELRFARYHPCAAPQLETPCRSIVHKEQKRALVLGEIADADVLLVARVIGKGDGVLIEHFQEPNEPSAVLDVGLTVGARSRKINGVSLANESNNLRGKLVRKASRASPTRIRVPRAAARLRGAHGRGEHHFVGRQICSGSGRTAARHRHASGPKIISSWGRQRD